MKITLEKLNKSLLCYVKEKIATQVKNPLLQFGAGFISGADNLHIENSVPESLMRTVGVMDEDGMICTETLCKGLKGGFSNAGKVDFYGLLSFDESDVRPLIDVIERS